MTANKHLPKILAGLIFLFCVVIFLPIFEDNAKWNYVIPIALAISLFASPAVLSSSKWESYSLKILGLLLVWYIFLFFHRYLFPPGTEYAFNKLPLLAFISFIGAFAIPAAVENFRAWHLAAAALTAVGAVFTIISFFPSTELSNARYSTIGLNPALLAKLTAIPIIAALSFRNGPSPLRTLLFVLAILAVAGSINTGSRTPLVAVCIAYAAHLLVRFRFKEIIRSAGIYTVLGAVFLIYLGFGNPEVVERFSFEALSVANNSDEGDRVFLYQLAIEIIQANPMGIGLGNFSTIFWINAPHNIYLESISETGWIGIIPVILLTWIGVKSSIFLFKADDAFGTFIAIFFVYNLVTSIVGNELTLPSLMFYISIGLSGAYAHCLKRERRDGPQPALGTHISYATRAS